MVEAKTPDLLSHPLCQNLLSVKWARFVRYLFYLNLFFRIAFVVILNVYTSHVVCNPRCADLLDEVNGCPIYLTDTQLQNETLVNFYLKNGQMTDEMRIESDIMFHIIIDVLIMAMTIAFGVQEIFLIVRQKLAYFVDVYNYMSLALLVCSVGYITPPMMKPCLRQWRFGWMAMFLSWINLIMYMRRIDWLGIYLIMLTAVFKSAAKMLIVVFFFICAFGSAFYIQLGSKPIFESFAENVVTITVMTLGELNYMDNFVEENLGAFQHDAFFMLLVFIVICPIMIMNLLVGIAVGDIEKIQKNAYFQRLAMQMITDIETTFPRKFQKKLHCKSHIIKPNARLTCCQRLMEKIFGSTRTTALIKKEDVPDDRLKSIVQEQIVQKRRIQRVQDLLEKQGSIIQELGRRFELETREINIRNDEAQCAFDIGVDTNRGAPLARWQSIE